MTAEENATATADATPDAAGTEVAETALTPRPSVLERLQGVPTTIRTYILSDDLSALHAKIFADHGISKDDQDLVYYTELQTFFGEIPLAEFPDRLWIRLDWSDDQEDKAVALVRDILGYIFLPAQAHLGDVAGLLNELDGDIKKYPEKQLELRRVTFVEGAREISEATGIEGLGSDMRKRLAHIIESRLRSVRDDGDTKEMLMKAKKTGGMELSEADAERVMAMLASKVRMTAFVEAIDESEPAGTAAEEEKPAEAAVKEYSPIQIKNLYSGTAEEQEAIKKRNARFRQVTEGDPAKMRDAFYQILFPPDLRPTDPMYVVAGLLGMTEDDRLSDAIENDDRYRNIVREFLKSKGKEEDLAAYEEDPLSPRFMGTFLQLLLRGIAGFDETESARFGLRVANALKKQGFDRYGDLAAFDTDKGEFTWKEKIEP